MAATDYQTYREIMDELVSPIAAEGLDPETLKRLYESKLVYLENLRVKCFYELNRNPETPFTPEDQRLIVQALKETQRHLRELILLAVNRRLERRHA